MVTGQGSAVVVVVVVARVVLVVTGVVVVVSFKVPISGRVALPGKKKEEFLRKFHTSSGGGF